MGVDYSVTLFLGFFFENPTIEKIVKLCDHEFTTKYCPECGKERNEKVEENKYSEKEIRKMFPEKNGYEVVSTDIEDGGFYYGIKLSEIDPNCDGSEAVDIPSIPPDLKELAAKFDKEVLLWMINTTSC